MNEELYKLTQKTADDAKKADTPEDQGQVTSDYRGRDFLGAVGRLKRAVCHWSVDEFNLWCRPEPRTPDTRQALVQGAARALDVGAAVVDSIPGGKAVCEFFSLTKHLMEVREKRRTVKA